MSNLSEKSIEALAAASAKSHKATREALQLAFARLRHGNPRVVPKGTRITAAAVSQEAGVDRATLYRYHEPVLSDIRRHTESTSQEKLKESRSLNAKSEEKLREYRQLAQEAQEREEKLARINHRLNARVNELEKLLAVREGVISGLQRQLNQAK